MALEKEKLLVLKKSAIIGFVLSFLAALGSFFVYNYAEEELAKLDQTVLE